MAEWEAAVRCGNSMTLADLIISAVCSRDRALTVLRDTMAWIEDVNMENRVPTTVTPPSAPAPTPTGTTLTSVTTTSAEAATGQGEKATGSSIAGPSSASLCTLEAVQLLQPRGRFDLEFREGSLKIAGKAGSVSISWQNIRHIIRLPRPEGYSWGKTDSCDPAGSDLLAISLKQPVPLRKNTVALLLMQPDPKARQAEVSFAVEGVSRKISGSQGTVVGEVLKTLSKIRQIAPDKSLFVTRENKSFVKCYHGVSEGSLFPLKQGLLFMKPGLFLPSGDIQEVVCGRGGSGQTRYVDLVVGMEACLDYGDGQEQGAAGKQHEFSNIPREYLASLQHYIQNALVAPRQREAKRAERAEKAEQNASKPQHEKLSTTLPQEPTPSVPAGDDAERANGPRADAGSGSSEGAGTKASAGQLPPNAEQSLAASVAGAGTNMEDGVTNDGDRETISGDRERDSEIMSSNTNGVKRERASASDVHDNGSVVVPTAGTRVATDQAIAFDRSKRAAAASAKLRDDADHDDALDLDSDESDEDFAPPEDSSSGDDSGDTPSFTSGDEQHDDSDSDDDKEEEEEEAEEIIKIAKRSRERKNDADADDGNRVSTRESGGYKAEDEAGEDTESEGQDENRPRKRVR